jgi:cytochrome b6-f complex iron-sulfur subunit
MATDEATTPDAHSMGGSHLSAKPNPVGAVIPRTAAKAGATPAAPAAAEKPRAKPQMVWEPVRKEVTRRGFLSTIGLAWTSFTAASAAGCILMQRFMFPNIPIYNPPMQFKAGSPGTYEIGKVDERWKQKYGTWIVRTNEGFYALSTICTHLGCTPNWLETEDKFKCPCHGSGFRKSGINFEGPAPRPLERFRIALAEDGQILVDKSRIFQQEKGDWEKPDSFLAWT